MRSMPNKFGSLNSKIKKVLKFIIIQLNQESKELDNLISKFASSANTLQQAYHSLENEMLDSLNSKEFVSVKNEPKYLIQAYGSFKT